MAKIGYKVNLVIETEFSKISKKRIGSQEETIKSLNIFQS
jgi:hypothetical protein